MSTIFLLVSMFFSLPAPCVTCSSTPAVMDFLYKPVCKYIVFPSVLSVFPPHPGEIGHCVPCYSECSLHATSFGGMCAAGDGAVPEWSDRWGVAPRWVGTETRSLASWSASSITPAHQEPSWATCQRAFWLICLQMWRGQTKEMEILGPDSVGLCHRCHDLLLFRKVAVVSCWTSLSHMIGIRVS